MTEANRSALHQTAITSEADRCVKCGLCLPHCPTYGLSRNEADSPRGRIALADALARGRLQVAPELLTHLDGCLLCRRCEQACPSAVHYGKLLDHARALTLAQRPRWLRAAAALLSRRRWVRLGLAASRLLPGPLLPGGPELARAAWALAGRQAPTLPHERRSGGPTVALFTGCVGGVLQASAVDAARRLLEAAGASVVTPGNQACCGALHSHLGELAKGQHLAEQNRAAFDLPQLEAIVSLASGCGAQLDEQTPALPAPHHDISQYLNESGLLDGLHFAPLEARAMLHTPCTLRNKPLAAAAVATLLARIPGLEVQPLQAGSDCCGAGGLHLLSHPDQGAALRAPKLDAIREAGADLVLTSNPGCALHLAAGLGREAPVVMHPVELLARQLRLD